MAADDGRCLIVIDSLLKPEQFRQRKNNIPGQQKNLHSNKTPEQHGSRRRFQPKEILYEKREQKVQKAKADKKNGAPKEFIRVKFPDESLEFEVNDSRIFQLPEFMTAKIKQ